jgi:tetratricopeptide (TPR) repeat protein
VSHRFLHLDDVEPLRAGGAGAWIPLRRLLGATGFGVNAYTADAGEHVIEAHDETSSGAGGHEELYFVVGGEAVFTVGDEEIAATRGTLLLVEPGTHREARAAADGTTVLVIGGRPGAALPVSPFEHWYLADPHYAAGDYDRAVEVASEGLADHPHSPGLNYQLACFHALAGRRDEALRHFRVAHAADRRVAAWAAGDDDLASIRDALPPLP